MKEEIMAFENLAKVLKTTVGAVKLLSEALRDSNIKRTLRNFKIEKKIEDLSIEIHEYLFDDGTMCNGCDLIGTHCEGSNCGNQMDAYFSRTTKDQAARKAFEVFGDRYYSFSMRIKNKLKR